MGWGGGRYSPTWDGYVQVVGIHPSQGEYVQGGWVLTTPPDTWDMGYYKIQSASGQYASYWNAFLFVNISLLASNQTLTSKMVHLPGPSVRNDLPSSNNSLMRINQVRLNVSNSTHIHYRKKVHKIAVTGRELFRHNTNQNISIIII